MYIDTSSCPSDAHCQWYGNDGNLIIESIPSQNSATTTVAIPPPAKGHQAMEALGTTVVIVIFLAGICTICFGIGHSIFAVSAFIHRCNETRAMLDEHLDEAYEDETSSK